MATCHNQMVEILDRPRVGIIRILLSQSQSECVVGYLLDFFNSRVISYDVVEFMCSLAYCSSNFFSTEKWITNIVNRREFKDTSITHDIVRDVRAKRRIQRRCLRLRFAGAFDGNRQGAGWLE